MTTMSALIRKPKPKQVGRRLPLVPLDSGAAIPLYEQLYRTLRERVCDGTLPAGSRVASTRALALELGVSRFTVVSAMERLLAEGYVKSRPGSGVFVVDILPEEMM